MANVQVTPSGVGTAVRSQFKDNGNVVKAVTQQDAPTPSDLKKSPNDALAGAEGILNEALKEMGADLDSDLVDDSEADVEEDLDEDATEEETEEEAEPAAEAEADGEKPPAEEKQPTEKKEKAEGDVEEITANGETIKIDYSDRAATKRAYEKAAGVDKLYGRYKQLKDEIGKEKEDAQNFRSMSETFGDGGEVGAFALLDRLTGGKGKEMVSALHATHFPAAAKPDAAGGKPAEAETPESKIAKLTAEVSNLRSETKVERAQAAIDGVFPSFSFSGKLGDAETEQRLDGEMFGELQARLSAAEKSGKTITHDVVKALMDSIAGAKHKALRLAATKLLASDDSKAAKAAKKAAQAAALGTSRGGSGGKAGKAAVDDNINWLDPSAIAKWADEKLR